MKRIIFFVCLVTMLFCLTESALAHKVRIFAYAEGSNIIGETAFSGGRVPKDAEIRVQDAASGKMLLTCRTDDQGRFQFPVPHEALNGKVDLLISILVGEGHRGAWILHAAEYLDGEEDGKVIDAKESPVIEKNMEEVGGAVVLPVSAIDEQLLRKLIDEELTRKLAPIKRMLAENRSGDPSLQDILGGIGYILGLAGIVAYFKSKRK